MLRRMTVRRLGAALGCAAALLAAGCTGDAAAPSAAAPTATAPAADAPATAGSSSTALGVPPTLAAPSLPPGPEYDCQRARPSEVRLPGAEVREAAEADANVVLKLSSSSRSVQEVTVAAGGTTLLRVRLPALPEKCAGAGGPVFTHRFALPAEPTSLAVTANEQRASAQITPRSDRQWVTVLPQDGVRLDVKVWQDEPLFG